MNLDQIKALKERADKASQLATDHKTISDVLKFDKMPWEFQSEALRLAKAGILARIEAEIAELLQPDQRQPAVAIASAVAEPWPHGPLTLSDCHCAIAPAFLDPTPTTYQPAEPEEPRAVGLRAMTLDSAADAQLSAVLAAPSKVGFNHQTKQEMEDATWGIHPR